MPDVPDDNTLIALALREHAQTCDGIAEHSSLERRREWSARAARCRVLAMQHEAKTKLGLKPGPS